MLDIGKLIPVNELITQINSFSSLLDIGKLIRGAFTMRKTSRFSSLLDIGKLILYELLKERRASFSSLLDIGRLTLAKFAAVLGMRTGTMLGPGDGVSFLSGRMGSGGSVFWPVCDYRYAGA